MLQDVGYIYACYVNMNVKKFLQLLVCCRAIKHFLLHLGSFSDLFKRMAFINNCFFYWSAKDTSARDTRFAKERNFFVEFMIFRSFGFSSKLSLTGGKGNNKNRE